MEDDDSDLLKRREGESAFLRVLDGFGVIGESHDDSEFFLDDSSHFLFFFLKDFIKVEKFLIF
jgi:hypothetical protein